MYDDSLGGTLRLYDQAIEENELLSFEEEQELGNLIKGEDEEKAEEAKDKLFKSNIRLIYKIAEKYKGRGIEFADLVQSGAAGLFTAIEKFEPSRGLRFSTLATWWVRQAITRSVQNEGNIIRKPAHIHEEKQRITKATRELIQKNGREPTEEEIAEKCNMSLSKVIDIEQYFQDSLSLDANISEDSEKPDNFLEILEKKQDIPEDLEKQYRIGLVGEMLTLLTKNEQDVICYKYGIYDGSTRTTREISNITGIDYRKVLNVEKVALNKMMKYCEAHHMEDSSFLADLFERKEKEEEYAKTKEEQEANL